MIPEHFKDFMVEVFIKPMVREYVRFQELRSAMSRKIL